MRNTTRTPYERPELESRGRISERTLQGDPIEPEPQPPMDLGEVAGGSL
jgi:hypothetical protein